MAKTKTVTVVSINPERVSLSYVVGDPTFEVTYSCGHIGHNDRPRVGAYAECFECPKAQKVAQA